mmetsp:Transcript_17929/g.27720  ORF Transcript_17929/g.27720 Transcript_17929/m.27720 type:complete len:333 (+) Transcript_17929:195-1193(+)|eukprot:CAMPEP_0195280940 /NCGR_PEP_ID=MMETSP0707-20130614/449_1 /TAXON_ID=33640 /ORGANISM="Asterionellopsis glacialis, Strain CCMP134" /LENGTH=332 /DNA_ID=CAMNT_0040339771 /DNA_START=102 /DNA_END=1103 /DNA_ORIENTATION=-
MKSSSSSAIHSLSSVDTADDDEHAVSSETLNISYESPIQGGGHPPLSPTSGAESFFLQGLPGTSETISAFALAAEIQRNKRGPTTAISASSSMRSLSAVSTATDEFQSACGDSVEFLDAYESSGGVTPPHPSFSDNISNTHGNNNNYSGNLFGRDVLVISKSIIPEEEELDNDKFEDPIMSTTTTETNNNMEQEGGPTDVAQNVYKGVKDVWAWGKGTPISSLLGIAEGVASKVVSMAGTNLEEIDGNIKPQVSNLDSQFLNPAIHAVVRMILGGVTKGDEFVRPIVMTILGPTGLFQIEKEEEGTTATKEMKKAPMNDINPETTTPPPVTA